VAEEVTEKTIQSESATKTEPKSGSGLWIGIIVLLMVVLIGGAGFYLLQQLRSQGDDITKEDLRNIENSKQISGFQSQLAAMQSQLTNATSTISNADERFDEKLANLSKQHEEKLDTTRKELTGSILQIQRQLGKTRGDWLIADAEYLLSVAGQRLHLIGDIETTREALEAADQRLRESGDAGAFKVREEIAKELASLHSIPALDLVGLYSKLQSLSDRVNNLTLFLPYEGKPVAKNNEHGKHNVPSLTSSDLLNAALKQIDAYVTVRHTEQPIKAILTAEQAQFIRGQLSLKLEMIKLALVQKNQTLYQASLNDALVWLDKNFNQNAETQHFVAELKQLNTIKLNAQMPDISLSLKMLRDITKLRIETDKALPPTNLEEKTEKPKLEAVKPAIMEEPHDSQPDNTGTQPEVNAPKLEKFEKPIENVNQTADKPAVNTSVKAIETSSTLDKTGSKPEPAKSVEPGTTAPTTVVKPVVVH
jgi:uncharacterized protein HemX